MPALYHHFIRRDDVLKRMLPRDGWILSGKFARKSSIRVHIGLLARLSHQGKRRHGSVTEEATKQHEMSALLRRYGGLRFGSNCHASDGATSIFFLPVWNVRSSR